MTPTIATIVYAIGILGLFWLDRDRELRTSKALWLPVIWLLIVASRPLSLWLQMTPPGDAPDTFLEGSPLDRLVFAALLVIGLWVLINRGQPMAKLLWANGPILLFFLYCAASTLWSDFPDVALKRWIKALGDLVMILIVASELEPSVAIKRLLKRVSFLLVPVSLLLIKYYPDLGRGYNRYIWTVYNTGATRDKNGLGLLCLVCGLGALWQFFSAWREESKRSRRRHLLAQGGILAMAMWLLWLANSVTSISCFVMGGIFIVAAHLFGWARRPAVMQVLAFTLVLVSIFALFLNPASGLLESVGRNPTLTGRTEVWAHVIPLNENPLIGSGYESFWLGERLEKMWSVFWWHPNEAHNGYLEVFLNLGWIGVVLLGLLIVTGYRNVFAAFRNNPELGSVKVGYFVAAVAYSFSEAGFRELSPIWIFFLLMITAVPRPSAVPEFESEPDFDFADNRTNPAVPIGSTPRFE